MYRDPSPTLFASSNGMKLAYDSFGDAAAQPLVLVMGLGTQMIAWDEQLCAMLAGRGFRVVRFDNRDVGRSTRLHSAGVPSRVDMMIGRRATAPYLLGDMARDTVGLMDHLGIDSAHVVGASMGGMIAQTVAIEHPQRIRSLVSMMSTTGSRRTGLPSRKAFGVLFGKPPQEREATIERAVNVFRVIGSPGYPFEEQRVREIAARSFDRGHSGAGVARQLHAITASGDRTNALQAVSVPTTVIHGESDVLVRPAGGRATADAVPGARLRMIEGMGHDLPPQLWPTFVEEIVANAERAREGDPAPAS